MANRHPNRMGNPMHTNDLTPYLLAANLLATITTAHLIHTTKTQLSDHLKRHTNHLKGVTRMATQDTVNAVTAQLRKAKDEILAKVADLQVQIDDAQVADRVDVSELVAVAQALDDVVPDPIVELPAEVPDELPAEVQGEE